MPLSRCIRHQIRESGFCRSLAGKGHPHFGAAFIGAGVRSFGGGIFLIAQMYHLTSNNILSFFVWSAAGAAALFLYGGRFLSILALVITEISQMYSSNELHQSSFSVLILTAVGLGFGAWRKKDPLIVLLLALGIFLQDLMFGAQKTGFGVCLIGCCSCRCFISCREPTFIILRRCLYSLCMCFWDQGQSRFGGCTACLGEIRIGTVLRARRNRTRVGGAKKRTSGEGQGRSLGSSQNQRIRAGGDTAELETIKNRPSRFFCHNLLKKIFRITIKIAANKVPPNTK